MGDEGKRAGAENGPEVLQDAAFIEMKTSNVMPGCSAASGTAALEDAFGL